PTASPPRSMRWSRTAPSPSCAPSGCAPTTSPSSADTVGGARHLAAQLRELLEHVGGQRPVVQQRLVLEHLRGGLDRGEEVCEQRVALLRDRHRRELLDGQRGGEVAGGDPEGGGIDR